MKAALLACAVSLLAASPHPAQEACLEQRASCREGCKLEFGASARGRKPLVACIRGCDARALQCVERGAPPPPPPAKEEPPAPRPPEPPPPAPVEEPPAPEATTVDDAFEEPDPAPPQKKDEAKPKRSKPPEDDYRFDLESL